MNIVTPISIGHAPITKNDGTSYGNNPKRLNKDVGSLQI